MKKPTQRKDRTAAELIREIAESDPEGHAERLGRGYGVDIPHPAPKHFTDLPEVGDFRLMPPAPDVCQTCARDHPPEAPHDALSLYYKYRFYADTGRWPGWADAMAHCEESVREAWTYALGQRGIVV